MGENGLKTPIRSQPGSSSSGLTLVIPSLKALKAKQLQALSEEPPSAKKTPRPVKLKPLREVLSSLITKIKKKDDYAFFLHPVDASQVPGYSELIQRPMDFGTMTTKVEKGRYRSLEEFSSDFQLVISNAKAFNPPGTIYHQEACRIEAWGSEHIAKSAAHVIEYETDWNIEIERDDEVVIDGEDDDAAGPSAGPTTPARRSPSVSSSVMPPAKRARGAAKKTGMPSETLEADGHLPGHKDGITAFPPGSDWAELMVALKLKGKRYKTKKERMRIEKGGPPYTAEGSIDYGEMEDPFNLLSVFVPDAPTNLQLTPIYPPNAPPDASETLAPAPVNTLIPEDTPPAPIAKPPSDNSIARTGCPKYRFWTVNRHTSSRAKAKEREDDEPPPPTAQPRTAVAADFGAFSTLPARLARESRVPAEHEGTAFTTEEKLFDALRESIEKRPRQGAVAGTQSAEELVDDAGYWTQERAMQAQDYIREVVYGGVDGLAYLRSVAEFITPGDATEARHDSAILGKGVTQPLGKPLAEYVEETLVDTITEGRHRTARAAATHVASDGRVPLPAALAAPFHTSSTVLPRAARLAAQIAPLRAQPLDLASLINAPEELFKADEEFASDADGRTQRVSLAEIDNDPAVLAAAMVHASTLIAKLEKRKAEARSALKEEEEEEESEDPVERELRMTLIALAKRAPLDQIGRMPAELVPAHLRGFVPTIGF